MKTYTVQALCRHISLRYVLLHDGEDWVEDCHGNETTFNTREEAEAFAESESESFEVSHEMKIVEFEDED